MSLEKKTTRDFKFLSVGANINERHLVDSASLRIFPELEHFHEVIKLLGDKGKFETSRGPDILTFNPRHESVFKYTRSSSKFPRMQLGTIFH